MISKRKIALDVGHGMHNRVRGVYDSGAVGSGHQEHKVVECFAYLLTLPLHNRCFQTTVIHDVPLSARDDRARAFGAKEMWSFHLNATPGATGTEVLIGPRTSPDLILRARAAGMAVAQTLGIRWRGVKLRRDLSILNSFPNTVLFELCFIDNASDMKKLHLHWRDTVFAVSRKMLRF